MDFLKLNQEFLNLQKKLEDSKVYIKKLNNLINKINKEINKLEQKNNSNIGDEQKIYNNLIIQIKSKIKKELEEIICEKN